MAGHRDARSVILWRQAGAKAIAQIEYWPAAGAENLAQRARSAPVVVVHSNQFLFARFFRHLGAAFADDEKL